MNQRSFYFLLAVFLMVTGLSHAQERLKIKATYCENKTEALGVDTKNIRFSWNLSSPDRGVAQIAYQILLAKNEKDLKSQKSLFWDSGKISSSQSILLNYSGPILNAGTSYFWKVKAWDNKRNESEWSEPARIITGLFSSEDWGEPNGLLLMSWIRPNGLCLEFMCPCSIRIGRKK